MLRACVRSCVRAWRDVTDNELSAPTSSGLLALVAGLLALVAGPRAVGPRLVWMFGCLLARARARVNVKLKARTCTSDKGHSASSFVDPLPDHCRPVFLTPAGDAAGAGEVRVAGGRCTAGMAACTACSAAHGPHAERLSWACAVRLGVCLHGASYV